MSKSVVTSVSHEPRDVGLTVRLVHRSQVLSIRSSRPTHTINDFDAPIGYCQKDSHLQYFQLLYFTLGYRMVIIRKSQHFLWRFV